MFMSMSLSTGSQPRRVPTQLCLFEEDVVVVRAEEVADAADVAAESRRVLQLAVDHPVSVFCSFRFAEVLYQYIVQVIFAGIIIIQNTQYI